MIHTREPTIRFPGTKRCALDPDGGLCSSRGDGHDRYIQWLCTSLRILDSRENRTFLCFSEALAQSPPNLTYNPKDSPSSVWWEKDNGYRIDEARCYVPIIYYSMVIIQKLCCCCLHISCDLCCMRSIFAFSILFDGANLLPFRLACFPNQYLIKSFVIYLKRTSKNFEKVYKDTISCNKFNFYKFSLEFVWNELMIEWWKFCEDQYILRKRSMEINWQQIIIFKLPYTRFYGPATIPVIATWPVDTLRWFWAGLQIHPYHAITTSFC